MTRARIYKPAKVATQSGMAKTHKWIVEFESQDKLEPEPLMGWVASKDTKRQLRLKFDTLDEALAFTKAKGVEYTIYNPTIRSKRTKDYGDNFTNPRIRGNG
jgi:hypothetical protein